MAKQICFFEKNYLDLDNESASITASQGSEFAHFLRNRSLKTAWLTTDSVDADEPNVDWDLGAPYETDRIILVDHNLKSYRLETYDPDTGIWTSIHSNSNDTNSTTEIELTEFYSQRMRLVVLGTQTANEDKRLSRIIVTKFIGRFSHWPKIDSPVIDQGKSTRVTLSGKRAILKTVGAVAFRLTLEHWREAADLALIETLYRQVQGFEVWPCGGDESQFFYATELYRKKDIYLMGFADDLKPKLKNGIYVNGMDLSLSLVEVVR